MTRVAPPSHEVRPRCSDALWDGRGEPVLRRRHKIRSVQAGFLFLALTDRQTEKTCVNNDKVIRITLVLTEIYTPCVICVCSHVKLVGWWEIQRAFHKLIHHRLALLRYVELKDGNKVENV